MKTLTFNVKEQDISKTEDFARIIKGSKGYLNCLFTFDPSWENFNAVAIFEHGENSKIELIDSNGMCQVPDSMTDYESFSLKILGIKSQDIYTYTNKVLIEQEG